MRQAATWSASPDRGRDAHRSTHLQWLSWRRWFDAQGCPLLQPQRWLYFNYAHQIVQAALAGQGLALARLPLVADALASGDLVGVLPGTRLDSPLAYWLLLGRAAASAGGSGFYGLAAPGGWRHAPFSGRGL